LRRAEAFHKPTRALFFVRAECRRLLGDPAGAAEDLKTYRGMAGATAWDYFLPGHTAGARGEVDEAIRSYREALRVQPDHFNSLFFLAHYLHVQKHEYLEAAGFYTACIAFRPRPERNTGWDDFDGAPGCYRRRAECYWKLGRMDAAEADYTSAISAVTGPLKLNGYEARLDFYRATAHPEKVREEEARYLAECKQVLEEYMKQGGSNYIAFALEHLERLGCAHWDKGDSDGALAAFRTVRESLEDMVRRYPSFSWQRHLAGFLALCPDGRVRDPGRAAELSRHLTEQEPNRAESWGSLGIAYYQSGRYAEAIPVLERGDRIWDGGGYVAWGWFYQAMAYRQLGDLYRSTLYYLAAVRSMRSAGTHHAFQLGRLRAEASEVLGLTPTAIAPPPRPKQ
jgi:tetratricopeptide (TPR) repeat protein